MLNLTRKAAQALKINFQQLEERNEDCWKVDIFRAGRRDYWLIAHERTLHTLVRPRTELRGIEAIADEIVRCFPWYRPFAGANSIGRNSDKRLTGTFTEMKRAATFYQFPDQRLHLEQALNDNLYTYLAVGSETYGTPHEALARYLQSR